MFLKTRLFFRTTQKFYFIWVKVEKWLSSVDDEELHTSLHLDGQYKTATRPKGLHHAVTVGWKSAKMSHSIFRIAIWTSMAKLYRLKNWIKMRHFGTFSTIVFNVANHENTQCLKINQKVSFNKIMSEASNICITPLEVRTLEVLTSGHYTFRKLHLRAVSPSEYYTFGSYTFRCFTLGTLHLWDITTSENYTFHSFWRRPKV